jgi:photosystem II stability/assembly factor-like uncharacterized protein
MKIFIVCIFVFLFVGKVAVHAQPQSGGQIQQLLAQLQDTIPQGWIKQISPSGQGYSSVSFISRDTGWLGGGVVGTVYTSDGGLHWTYQNPSFTNAFWAVAGLDGKTACGAGAGQIFRTTDAGQTWTPQFGRPSAGFTCISFPTKDTGFVIGRSSIVWSVDSGKTWTTYDLPAIESAYIYSCNFYNARNGLVVGHNRVYHISVGPTNPGYSDQTQPKFNLMNFHGCCLASPDIEFAVGTENILSGGIISAIMRSTDRGNNWSRISVADAMIDSAYFTGISFPDVLHGTAVGSGGIIIHTTDGGDTWTRQHSGVTGDFNAVDFTDSLTGTIVGPGGLILRTMNGGYSWVRPQYQTDTIAIQVYPNPTTGLVTIQYNLPSSTTVSLIFTDIRGIMVGSIPPQLQAAGTHQTSFDGSLLSTGVYYFTLNTSLGSYNGQVTIER